MKINTRHCENWKRYKVQNGTIAISRLRPEDCRWIPDFCIMISTRISRHDAAGELKRNRALI